MGTLLISKIREEYPGESQFFIHAMHDTSLLQLLSGSPSSHKQLLPIF